MPEQGVRHWWGTPLVGLAGGFLASQIGWPLPWMVGSLLAIILVRCLTPWQLAEIPGGRKCGQWIVGIGIGLHFTPVVIEQVLAHFGLIFIGALLTSVSSVIGVWIMRRSGEDRATAFFSSMPGGSGEMVNLGARNGAVLSRVAAGQVLHEPGHEPSAGVVADRPVESSEAVGHRVAGNAGIGDFHVMALGPQRRLQLHGKGVGGGKLVAGH